MLLSRNPELLRRLSTNFDALFNIANLLTAFICWGASYGFDERAVALILVPFFVSSLEVLGDATMSDFEFEIRRYFLLIIGLETVSGAWFEYRDMRAQEIPGLRCKPSLLSLLVKFKQCFKCF